MRNSTRLFAVLVLALFLQVTVAAPAHAGFLGSVVDSVKGAVSGVVDSVKSGVSSVVGSVTGAVKGVVDSVKEGVTKVFGSVVEAGKQVYSSIKDTVKNVVGSVTGTAMQAVQQAAGNIQNGIQGVADIAKGAVGAAGDGLSGLLGKLNSGGLGDLANKIKSGVDNVKGFISGKIDDAKGFLGMIKEVGQQIENPIDLLGQAKKIIEDNPIVKNIAKLQENLTAKAATVADKIKETISSAKDGVAGIIAKGAAFVDQYKGDAAKIVAEQIDKLTALRADPKKFNQTFGEIFNASNTTGNVSSSASMSMGGFKLFAGNDDAGQAENEISKHKLLLNGEAWLGPRIDTKISGSYLDGKGQVSLENRFVAGLDGQVSGNAKWLTDGALIDAKGKVSATAGLHNTTTFKNNIDLGGGFGSNTTAIVDAMAGAQAKASGTLYAGKNGLEVKGGAEARVGLWADASGSTSMQYKGQNLFTAEGTAGAGLGVGAGAKGGVSFRADKVGFSAQVTLGPVKLGGGIYVNPVAMTQLAVDKGKQVVNAVGNAANSVADGAKKLWNKLF